ncbi:MAG: class I tRNA ligase family protein, partial [Erysipelotrichales bacterium]|nr:class I tRNA ligase family protein [Erysipelotrichales bacterium]
KLCDKFGLEKREVLRTFKGKELEYITVKHPFYDRTSMVCNAEYVTDEDGTGCVHTASGHGLDDFYTCQRYGMPVLCPVDEKGLLTKEAGEDLEGLFVFDADPIIINKLDQLGCLLAKEKITHSYPFDERMKKPIIYRATVQWFASIDKIRAELLDQIKNNIRWENDFGEVRMYNMIRDRQDWCISRQRVWGVPIPIIYTEDGQPIFEEKVFEHIAQLFEEFGSNVWFEREAKDLLPEGYTNPASPNGLFTKEKDIMDVWFDSGSSFNTLISRGYPFPCDIYFEGSDQYRGWFNSSLIVSVATYGKAPYKSVLSHGYVLDGKGYQMHKSAGNAVDPQSIIKVYGADIIRLWAATSDYRQDVRCSDDLFKHVSETYRKIRNTFRFMLSVTSKTRKDGTPDFDYTKDAVPFEKMSKVNRTMEVLISDLTKKIVDAYMKYDFLGAVNTLANFLSNEMSSFYLDFTKDTLYIEEMNAGKRREAQTVIYDALKSCLLLIAPVLSYTAEEIWDYANDNDGTSVFLHDFPEAKEYENAEEYRTFFKKLMAVRDDALKAMELSRAEGLIGKSLEAKVVLDLNEEFKCLKEELSEEELADLLIVSELEYAENDGAEYPCGRVLVEKAEG